MGGGPGGAKSSITSMHYTFTTSYPFTRIGMFRSPSTETTFAVAHLPQHVLQWLVVDAVKPCTFRIGSACRSAYAASTLKRSLRSTPFAVIETHHRNPPFAIPPIETPHHFYHSPNRKSFKHHEATYANSCASPPCSARETQAGT